MPSLSNPIAWFEQWLADARNAGMNNAEAMTLATVGKGGVPSARMVLYKGMLHGGFSFFTNYQSRKARELDAKPRAALVFHWDPLQRQVRVEGRIKRCTAAESDRYFASRDRGSQIGAWASRQSTEIPAREELEARVAEFELRFKDKPVPRPKNWGGYVVIPERIEFWQGRSSRLHERTLYTRRGSRWKTAILAP